MVPIFYILIVLAICMSVFIWSGWGVSLGKDFGVLAVSLAIYIILCSWLVPSGVWIFVVPVSLFFAGLSGFFKNTLLSMSAIIITTIFLIYSLLPSPQIPLGFPPQVPIQPIRVDPSWQAFSLPSSLPTGHSTPVFSTSSTALILIVFYLFAITGIISNVIQNRYNCRSTHAGPTRRSSGRANSARR